MKNFKSLFSLALVCASVMAFGQTKQKTTNDVLEYVAAEYDHVSLETVLKLKNSKGEILSFHYSANDQSKAEEILFNKPLDPTTAKSVAKPELIGHKYNVGYTPITATDPANSTCCFKIVSVSELESPKGSSK